MPLYVPLHWTDKFDVDDQSLLYSNHHNYAIRAFELMSAQSAAGVHLAPSGWPSAATRDPNEVKKERFSGAPAAEMFLDDAAERRIANARRPTKRMVSFATTACKQGLLQEG